MSNKDTGGPAFPVHPDMAAQLGCVPSSSDAGMSLRDYFAAKASEEDIAEYMPTKVGEAKLYPHRTRQWARYKHADAMLKAREQ